MRGLPAVIRTYAASGKPLLGICLGMQMLLDERGVRHHARSGTDSRQGRSCSEPKRLMVTPRKFLHIGWSALYPASDSWSGTLLDDSGRLRGLFVHSFMAQTRCYAPRGGTCMAGTASRQLSVPGNVFSVSVPSGKKRGSRFGHPARICACK